MQGCAFSGLQNINLMLKPYLSPKTVKFWPKMGLRILRPKMLNNGGAQEKTTLNHHRSPIEVAQ